MGSEGMKQVYIPIFENGEFGVIYNGEILFDGNKMIGYQVAKLLRELGFEVDYKKI